MNGNSAWGGGPCYLVDMATDSKGGSGPTDQRYRPDPSRVELVIKGPTRSGETKSGRGPDIPPWPCGKRMIKPRVFGRESEATGMDHDMIAY